MNMKWIHVHDRLPTEGEKALAVCVSEPNMIYNMRHDGWFRDTMYACRMHNGKFIIESHGPYLPATHWMPLPKAPEHEMSEMLLDEQIRIPS